MKYCECIDKTIRWKTHEVMVGSVGVGGANPIRIQSMTTSSTRDVNSTVDQIIRLADEGCEIARVTVQGIKEADACEAIKNALLQKGCTIPIVADIHFYPPAAMRVADFVDKVRVNPGNFVDKRATFKIIEYDDASYLEELKKIEDKFTPLVEKCKRLKRAMRIGTNHGSLSDRIMNRYGDTPQGMVESAFEFARICRSLDYHAFIFSMKASNPLVMIQAYRLLAAEMMKLGWDYPLHLGVTEAGQGEDGRIKSAMGIGSLLLDGLGDTIRVSLTEDAWREIDPCKRLIRFAESYASMPSAVSFEETTRSIVEIRRRQVAWPKQVAMHRDGTVFVKVGKQQVESPSLWHHLGCEGKQGEIKITSHSADGIVLQDMPQGEEVKHKVKTLLDAGVSCFCASKTEDSPIVKICTLEQMKEEQKKERFTLKLAQAQPEPLIICISDEHPDTWEVLKQVQAAALLFAPRRDRLHAGRQFFEWIKRHHITAPVILNFSYTCSQEDFVIHAAAECGALLADGLGEGVCLEGPYDLALLRQMSFSILQAARMRMSKTDFISCPSCGRTLFDLQDVTKRITARTAHLPGVKIAIMGCIVNGPGEMADADFGYVGSKPGMIDLYVGKKCVERDIPFAVADDRLIELIKAEGRWSNPEIIS